ncbi:MAG TPA: alkaline phosphatase D family protein [Bacteroidota bacterium]
MTNHLYLCILYITLLCFLLNLSSLGEEKGTLRSGPMVGYSEMTEVMLWVQMTGPAELQYRFWEAGNPQSARTTESQRVTRNSDFIAHTRISGLKEGQHFEYELMLDGRVVARPYPLRFQTQQLWQWRKDPPSFSVALGSCAYINDPPDDRPGTPYGSDYEIFTAIAEKSPDLMLWLGDNTYYREIDYTSVDRMKYRNGHTRALPEMQPLLGAAHNYAIWDDHDFGPDNSDRTFSLREDALDIFKIFWANHTYGTAEISGIFGRFLWADVEFFLLDDRYHRSPNEMPKDDSKAMFGNDQFAWLKESLSQSKAPFKIIVNGNQILAPASKHEALCNYPGEYHGLIRWIKDQKIEGIVCISGDIHSTQLTTLRDSLFYPLYDLTSSSLTAGIYRIEGTPPSFYDETKSVFEHNFALLKFDGPRTDRRLVMECYDKKGKVLWSQEIQARDLKVK